MIDTFDTPRIYVIPGWIYRSIIKNKINVIDKTDYTEVRKVLSTDDLASWFYLNNNFKVNGANLSNTDLYSLFLKLSEENDLEVKTSIVPLIDLKDVVNRTIERLTATNNMTDSDYSIISNQNFILVVLNEGFLSSIQKKENLYQFVISYLKSCYALMPIAEVSYLSLFNLYVNIIK